MFRVVCVMLYKIVLVKFGKVSCIVLRVPFIHLAHLGSIFY